MKCELCQVESDKLFYTPWGKACRQCFEEDYGKDPERNEVKAKKPEKKEEEEE